MLQTICSAIRASLDDLIANVNNSTINVGFMTFDQTIHFYKLSVLLSYLLLLFIE